MSKLVLIDFKDSFTFNIQHYLVGMGVDVVIFEDGCFEIEELQEFDQIILSPGPGLPSEKHSLKGILGSYSETKMILGICLGMQGIVEFFGGKIYNQQEVKHGVTAEINIHDHTSLFKSIPDQINVGLYHSWACDIIESTELKTLADSQEGVIMAVQHVTLSVFGVQFHPESILSEYGKGVLFNFINFKH